MKQRGVETLIRNGRLLDGIGKIGICQQMRLATRPSHSGLIILTPVFPIKFVRNESDGFAAINSANAIALHYHNHRHNLRSGTRTATWTICFSTS